MWRRTFNLQERSAFEWFATRRRSCRGGVQGREARGHFKRRTHRLRAGLDDLNQRGNGGLVGVKSQPVPVVPGGQYPQAVHRFLFHVACHLLGWPSPPSLHRISQMAAAPLEGLPGRASPGSRRTAREWMTNNRNQTNPGLHVVERHSENHAWNQPPECAQQLEGLRRYVQESGIRNPNARKKWVEETRPSPRIKQTRPRASSSHEQSGA